MNVGEVMQERAPAAQERVCYSLPAAALKSVASMSSRRECAQ